jgi:succinate-semialdehyde dehydrogenase/glutarate-semialdehyde dehydrogenase
LGGNAPFIVFDDVDIEMAVKGALASKYRNAGQTCLCSNRILVPDGVYDAFTKRRRRDEGCRRFEPGAVIGSLIDMEAVEKVEAHIADALKKGAKIVTGGKRTAQGDTFFEPTVLSDVTTDMVITKEETFGPVAPLYRFKTDSEAIKMANDAEFGLAAYFYSRDIGRIWRVAEALEYGMVGINERIISTEIAPFGGMKERGIGREGSKYGIDEFLEVKYFCIGGIDR